MVVVVTVCSILPEFSSDSTSMCFCIPNLLNKLERGNVRLVLCCADFLIRPSSTTELMWYGEMTAYLCCIAISTFFTYSCKWKDFFPVCIHPKKSQVILTSLLACLIFPFLLQFNQATDLTLGICSRKNLLECSFQLNVGTLLCHLFSKKTPSSSTTT